MSGGTGMGALGLGRGAIGGAWPAPDGSPLGWGKADDGESVAVDLHQRHLGDVPLGEAAELRYVCEEFVAEGLIRAYGRSAEDPVAPKGPKPTWC